MECPRRRNITYKETGEIWFMTVRVMRFLPGMSRYFSSSSGGELSRSSASLHHQTYNTSTSMHTGSHSHINEPSGSTNLILHVY